MQPGDAVDDISQHVDSKVCENFITLFRDGHSPASALYIFEDDLYLNITNEQELLEILADRAYNPGYDYIAKLFQQYQDNMLGGCNRKSMFERLAAVVLEYNNSGWGRVVLQEYNANSGNAFILCIVTNLMARIYKKIHQAQEICYMDASASFDPLNTSIMLLYTSCAAGALPLGLFITSNELEITIEKQ
ncbi:39343_t:CDS:2 [Gigaspora margarita]|uniref:39343_t:CDS:1 n=1 Tax=Gigaspora margarita TaxID=4874 RepID=A0ABN7USP8_GIGMA|nr:39343_t:CDS:2 [Gigaspora margarita]